VRPSAFPGTIGTDIATGDLAVARDFDTA